MLLFVIANAEKEELPAVPKDAELVYLRLVDEDVNGENDIICDELPLPVRQL